MDIQWGEVIPTVTSLGTLLFVALRFPSDRGLAKSKSSSDTAQTFQTYVETVQDLNDRLLKRNSEVSELNEKYDRMEASFNKQERAHKRLFRLEREARLKAEKERDELRDTVALLQDQVNTLQQIVNELRNPAQAALLQHQS